jgi:hypothetical protein
LLLLRGLLGGELRGMERSSRHQLRALERRIHRVRGLSLRLSLRRLSLLLRECSGLTGIGRSSRRVAGGLIHGLLLV